MLSAAQMFGEGSTPYMVDRVNCSGSEEILAECSHLGVNVHNCRKFQEAGVRCGKNKLPCIFIYNCIIFHWLYTEQLMRAATGCE